MNTQENCAVSDAQLVTAGTHSVALHISGRDTTGPRAHFDYATIQVLFVAITD